MSDCYTHNPYVPYMPDTNHVDSCPHTAVDNTLVIRMVCARSDGVLSGSWVHVPRPPRFHTRVFQPFRSRFPSRDLYGFHPYHRRGKKPRSRTADQIRPVWFHRSLYSRSVPIFRTTLWRYARRITMAVAIAAPPLIWYIPTLSSLPSVSSQFSATRQGIYAVWSFRMNFISSSVRRYAAHSILKYLVPQSFNTSYASSANMLYIFNRLSSTAILFKIVSFIIVCLLNCFTFCRDTLPGLSLKVKAIN